MKKRIISILLALVLCMMPLSVAFASGSTNSASGWQNQGDDGKLPDEVMKAAGGVFKAIKTAGLIVAGFILVYFGFKYLTAGAGEKAKVKEQLVPFIIGAALIGIGPMVAEWIWGIVT